MEDYTLQRLMAGVLAHDHFADDGQLFGTDAAVAHKSAVEDLKGFKLDLAYAMDPPLAPVLGPEQWRIIGRRSSGFCKIPWRDL